MSKYYNFKKVVSTKRARQIRREARKRGMSFDQSIQAFNGIASSGQYDYYKGLFEDETYGDLYREFYGLGDTLLSEDDFNNSFSENKFFSGLGNLWNKWTGNGITDAQLKENNMNRENLLFENELNYEMWKRTQSYEAQMQSMKTAGLNPALMFNNGGNMQQANTGSIAPISSTPSEGMPSLLGFINSIMQMSSLKSENALRKTQSDKNKAEADSIAATTEKTKTETQILEIDKEYADIRNRIYTTEGLTRIKNNLKDIEIKDGTIRLQNSQITLNLSDANLKDKQALVSEADRALKEIDAEKARALLPFAVQYLKSDISLKNAQTEESKANAIKLHADSLVQFAEAAIKQGLADNDYVGKFLRGLDADSALKYAQTAHENQLTTLTRNQQFTEIKRAENISADTEAKKAQTSRDEALTEKFEKENDWYVADKLLGYFGSYISAVADGFGTMSELLIGAAKVL